MQKSLFVHYQKGQALITLLVFVIIAITITTAAVVMIVNNSVATTKVEQGSFAYYVAESGIENALMRLLRDPHYCNEVLSVGSGSATIVVKDTNNTCNGTSPFTISSTGVVGSFSRTIQVNVQFNTGTMIITSWKEI